MLDKLLALMRTGITLMRADWAIVRERDTPNGKTFVVRHEKTGERFAVIVTKEE